MFPQGRLNADERGLDMEETQEGHGPLGEGELGDRDGVQRDRSLTV